MNIIFWTLLALFLIEQILYWSMLDYPFYYGLKIRTIRLPKTDLVFWRNSKHRRIYAKVDDISNDIYLRFKYGFGSLGPLLFVGQIESSDTSKLHMRVGYFSAAFLLWAIIALFLAEHQLINSFLISILVGVFYYRFLRSINGIQFDQQ